MRCDEHDDADQRQECAVAATGHPKTVAERRRLYSHDQAEGQSNQTEKCHEASAHVRD
jgi:hypothetical protein